MSAIFDGALVSVHFEHSPVGKYDVVMTKYSVIVASSATAAGMKNVHHRIAVSINVGDSTVLVLVII